MILVENLTNMSALRREIDAVDAEIVARLARRAALIDRAILLKPQEGLPARIDARIAAVIGHTRACAVDAGLDPELVERLWRLLIEWSIAREEAVLGPASGGRDHHAERCGPDQRAALTRNATPAEQK